MTSDELEATIARRKVFHKAEESIAEVLGLLEKAVNVVKQEREALEARVIVAEVNISALTAKPSTTPYLPPRG